VLLEGASFKVSVDQYCIKKTDVKNKVLQNKNTESRIVSKGTLHSKLALDFLAGKKYVCL